MNFFITNREIQLVNGKERIREDGAEHAGDNLRFGTYDTTTDFVLFPEPTDANETVYHMDGSTAPGTLKGSAQFFKTLYDALINDADDPNNNVLFFIHGFNTDLNGVRHDFAELNKNYVVPGSPIKHIIIFTWPSRHPIIPYHYFDDKKDAIRSGEALARGIEKVILFFKEFLVNAQNKPCKRNINMMVHSMGNRVLKHMMLQLKANNTAIPELFNEIILIAADIEYDIFEPGEAFLSLIDLGARIHVYFNHEDRVLDISKYTKNFSNRLGRYGRKRIDPTLVHVIDANASGVKEDRDAQAEEKLLNHWYYYTSSQVINDAISVMNGWDSVFRVKA